MLETVTWQDTINGCYELFAGSLLILNIRQLYLDKRVNGIHILPTMVFASWSWWNLYYYPHLNQWLSFWGCIVMVVLNSIWIGQMFYYKHGRLFWR